MATDAIQDPFRQQLLKTLNMSQAESGQSPDLLNDSLPPVDVPDQVGNVGENADADVGTEDVGIKASILAGTRAAFNQDLQTVQENALRKRQFRSGVTSQREIEAARNAQDRRIAALGTFEGAERDRREKILAGAAQQETAGTQALEQITAQGVAQEGIVAAQGLVDQANIEAQGVETRANIEAQGSVDIANIAAQGVEDVENIEAQAIADAANIAAKGSVVLAQIKAQGVEDRLTAEQQQTLDREIATGNISTPTQMTLQEVHGLVVAGFNGAERELLGRFLNLNTEEEIAAYLDTHSPEQISAQLYDIARVSPSASNMLRSILDAPPPTEASISQEKLQLDKRVVALSERSQVFNERVTTANITGIWETYGAVEMDDFTKTFGSRRGGGAVNGEGEPIEYNDRYDFDGDGNVDYDDYLAFNDAVAMGGVPTMALKALREETRQYNITTANGMQEFQDTLDATIDAQDMDRDQAFLLTIKALESNETIQAMGLDVSRMASLVDLLSGDGVDALSPNDIGAIIDITVYGAESDSMSLNRFGLTSQNLDKARSTTQMFNNAEVDGSGSFMMADIQTTDISSWYEEVMSRYDGASPELQETWLSLADIDGDGFVTDADKLWAALA